MSIAFKPCNVEEFILHRKEHPNKTINSKYLKLFNTQVFEIVNQLPNITGFIKYKNGDDVDNIKDTKIFI